MSKAWCRSLRSRRWWRTFSRARPVLGGSARNAVSEAPSRPPPAALSGPPAPAARHSYSDFQIDLVAFPGEHLESGARPRLSAGRAGTVPGPAASASGRFCRRPSNLARSRCSAANRFCISINRDSSVARSRSPSSMLACNVAWRASNRDISPLRRLPTAAEFARAVPRPAGNPPERRSAGARRVPGPALLPPRAVRISASEWAHRSMSNCTVVRARQAPGARRPPAARRLRRRRFCDRAARRSFLIPRSSLFRETRAVSPRSRPTYKVPFDSAVLPAG